MKCIDCKFCAYIKNSDTEMIVSNNEFSSQKYIGFKGSFCLVVGMLVMGEVNDCSHYEKSNIKKIKPFK